MCICAHTITNKHCSLSPAVDPQSLFPSPWENNREKAENVLFFFLLEKQSALICREMLRINPLYSFVPIPCSHPQITPPTHSLVHTSGYLDRDTLLSVSLSLWGVGRCTRVCVRAWVHVSVCPLLWMFSLCHQTGRRKFPPAVFKSYL